MYLQRLELKNTGPIQQACIDFRFNADLTPKPIIFVGQNGSGKSVATAHIVNALIDAHGTVFEDSDVEKGRVFKLRSPTYIRHGEEYSTGRCFSQMAFRFMRPSLFVKKVNSWHHSPHIRNGTKSSPMKIHTTHRTSLNVLMKCEKTLTITQTSSFRQIGSRNQRGLMRKA